MTNPSTSTQRMQRDIRKVVDWPTADTALGVLRLVDAELAQVQAEYDEQIQQIEAAKRKAVAPLQKKRDRVEELVIDFAETQKGQLPKKARSIKLVHGTVGWRKGAVTVTLIGDEEHTIEQLKARGQFQCVVTTENLDKSEVKKLPASVARQCGITITQTDRLYYKLKNEPIPEYPEVDEAGTGDE